MNLNAGRFRSMSQETHDVLVMAERRGCQLVPSRDGHVKIFRPNGTYLGKIRSTQGEHHGGHAAGLIAQIHMIPLLTEAARQAQDLVHATGIPVLTTEEFGRLKRETAELEARERAMEETQTPPTGAEAFPGPGTDEGSTIHEPTQSGTAGGGDVAHKKKRARGADWSTQRAKDLLAEFMQGKRSRASVAQLLGTSKEAITVRASVERKKQREKVGRTAPVPRAAAVKPEPTATPAQPRAATSPNSHGQPVTLQDAIRDIERQIADMQDPAKVRQLVEKMRERKRALEDVLAAYR